MVSDFWALKASVSADIPDSLTVQMPTRWDWMDEEAEREKKEKKSKKPKKDEVRFASFRGVADGYQPTFRMSLQGFWDVP